MPGVSAVGVVMNSMLDDMAPADSLPSRGRVRFSVADCLPSTRSRSAMRFLGARLRGAKAVRVLVLSTGSLRALGLVCVHLLACACACASLASLSRDSSRAVADGRPAVEVKLRWLRVGVVCLAGFAEWKVRAVRGVGSSEAVRAGPKEQCVVTVVMRPVATSLEANSATDQMMHAGKEMGTVTQSIPSPCRRVAVSPCWPCAVATGGRNFFHASMSSANRGAANPAPSAPVRDWTPRSFFTYSPLTSQWTDLTTLQHTT